MDRSFDTLRAGSLVEFVPAHVVREAEEEEVHEARDGFVVTSVKQKTFRPVVGCTHRVWVLIQNWRRASPMIAVDLL